MEKKFDEMLRLMDSGTRNIVQSANDEYCKKNAEFRAKAGLEVLIIRESLGECCSWCSDLEGVYTYDTAPDDVYARHRDCNCVVSTRTKKGSFQDAWSKKEYKSYRENRIARAEELEKEKEGQGKYEKNIRQIMNTVSTKSTGGKWYKPINPDNKKDVQAAKEYRKISRRNDIAEIAKSSGKTEEDIKQIKRHIFYEKHQLIDEYRTLDPDYDIAVAWKRLYNGVPEGRDYLLLDHELLESQIEKAYNLSLREAHFRAQKVFNWEKRLYDECGPLGELDGLL